MPFAGDALGDGERVGLEVLPEHQRAGCGDDGELLLGDVRDRRPEPPRVLQPDVGEDGDGASMTLVAS